MHTGHFRSVCEIISKTLSFRILHLRTSWHGLTALPVVSAIEIWVVRQRFECGQEHGPSSIQKEAPGGGVCSTNTHWIKIFMGLSRQVSETGEALCCVVSITLDNLASLSDLVFCLE
jgi:hypothetical protein